MKKKIFYTVMIIILSLIAYHEIITFGVQKNIYTEVSIQEMYDLIDRPTSDAIALFKDKYPQFIKDISKNKFTYEDSLLKATIQVELTSSKKNIFKISGIKITYTPIVVSNNFKDFFKIVVHNLKVLEGFNTDLAEERLNESLDKGPNYVFKTSTDNRKLELKLSTIPNINPEFSIKIENIMHFIKNKRNRYASFSVVDLISFPNQPVHYTIDRINRCIKSVDPVNYSRNYVLFFNQDPILDSGILIFVHKKSKDLNMTNDILLSYINDIQISFSSTKFKKYYKTLVQNLLDYGFDLQKPVKNIYKVPDIGSKIQFNKTGCKILITRSLTPPDIDAIDIYILNRT